MLELLLFALLQLNTFTADASVSQMTVAETTVDETTTTSTTTTTTTTPGIGGNGWGDGH